MEHSKSMKRAQSLGIDIIDTNKILFVPMIARRVTLEETALYERLTEERFQEIRASPEQIDFEGQDLKFHMSKTGHDETSHVKVRLLHHDEDLPVSFRTKKVKTNEKRKIDKVVIHFHGGGFVAMDSASHQNYTR